MNDTKTIETKAADKHYYNATRLKTNRVEVLLLPDVYKQLKQVSAELGLAMTTVMKLALQEYLDKYINK